MVYINKYLQFLAKAFLLSLASALVACGGGGGGGSPSSNIPASTNTYAGATTQATIDNASAKELNTSYIAANNNNFSGVATGISTTSVQNNIPLDIKYKVFEKLKQDAINVTTLSLNTTIITAVSALTGGNCAALAPSELNLSNGTLSQTILTQSFSEIVIKFTYNNLCRYNTINSSYTILSGDIFSTVSGDLQAGIINTLEFIIPGLSINYVDLSTVPSQSFTSVLSQKLVTKLENYVGGFPTKITFTDFTDVDSSGTVYRFENIMITENNITDGIEVRFYHPTIGWIKYEDTLAYNSSTCANGAPTGGSFKILSSTTYLITPNGDCLNYTVTTL